MTFASAFPLSEMELRRMDRLRTCAPTSFTCPVKALPMTPLDEHTHDDGAEIGHATGYMS